ncbi:MULTISPECIES: OmpA family protein [unclassified Thalassotalea]|uniref:OmpA family protein n=1 Tax=unclassified Thalassotalea TaxID=2614972 RepID=UPI001081A41B|nr:MULTISPECIES: OmpA family protein [unclassified Thalassotalea]NMP17758.1 OmpA family protein [Thalassotalea sp. Y01]QBY05444.1 glycine zipper 2TM domain-containing protein [Thalassotalea sp. HSM 43]
MNKSLSAFVVASILLSGCQTTRENAHTGEAETNSTTIGAITGAIGGAIVGAATSSKSDRKKGALQGLVGGAVIGAGVGNHLDKQEALLRDKMQQSGVQVKRINENQLQLVMTNGIGFDTGSYYLQPQITSTLNGVVEVLREFPESKIRIEGHTDSIGSVNANQTLSENRASSVLNYFFQNGVARDRLIAVGLGESQPVCDNINEQGRQCNRRVEINILPTS